MVTGNVPGAGTINPNVFLVLIGSNNCTKQVNISKGPLFSKHLATGTYEDIIVKVWNSGGIGEVEVIWFWMEDYFLKTSWYIEFVEIRSSFGTKRFPCHHWIKGGDKISLTSKTCK